MNEWYIAVKFWQEFFYIYTLVAMSGLGVCIVALAWLLGRTALSRMESADE